jgi:hypothetical protein
MSSATSIDGVKAEAIEAKGAPGARHQSRDTFRPWHFFVLASLMAATAAVLMTRQARPEHLVVISLTIGAAGFAAAALYRTLVPLVSPDLRAANEPLTESLRAVLEREKMLVLRSIKELEFDRAMGKVSPKDFDEMAGRLRTRAMSLMRQLDAGAGYRELIERELSARMRKPSAGSRQKPSTSTAAEPGVPAVVAAPAAARTCACGTVNDPDAAFCKRCGARMAPLPS